MNDIQLKAAAKPTAPKKIKVSVYLNPERSAALALLIHKDPSCTSTQEALYQLIDWWSIQQGHLPPVVQHEELSEIRRLLAHSLACHETLAQKTANALCSLVEEKSQTEQIPICKPIAPRLTSVSKPALSGQCARTAHKSLADWLLDTLTRVSGNGATKVVAVLRPLPRTDTCQQQFVSCQLLSVEGVALTTQHESAIDEAAFEAPLNLNVPTYLVCHRKAERTWEAQIRTKSETDKSSTVISRQDIKH